MKVLVKVICLGVSGKSPVAVKIVKQQEYGNSSRCPKFGLFSKNFRARSSYSQFGRRCSRTGGCGFDGGRGAAECRVRN